MAASDDEGAVWEGYWDDGGEESAALMHEDSQLDGGVPLQEVVASKKVPKPKATGKKRLRQIAPPPDDDDGDGEDDDGDVFELQPSILKWMRPVPGPLHDVMKKQHADLQSSLDVDDGAFASGRSSGHAVHISTVFDDGAWVDMCKHLGLATRTGVLYGGIKMSALKHTVAHILDDDQSSPKIPQLLVLVKSMRSLDEEIVAVFHDPTAEIDGYFHRDLVEQIGRVIAAGVGVLLRDVSVFAPTDAVIGGARKRYLNITPRNLERIFIPVSGSNNAYESVVQTFNEGQTALVGDELRQQQDDEHNELPTHRSDRVLAPADVRNTTNELSFISQRLVVQRHQPVPANSASNGMSEDAPADASTTTQKKKKKGKKAEQPSGLGRWQWHQLIQKKPGSERNTHDSLTSRQQAPTTAAPRPSSSSRFRDLLSQHVQARRRDSLETRVQASIPTMTAPISTSATSPRPPGRVTFADTAKPGSLSPVRGTAAPSEFVDMDALDRRRADASAPLKAPNSAPSQHERTISQEVFASFSDDDNADDW